MWSNLLVNTLITVILVNRLVIFARKRVLAMDFSEQNDPSLVLLISKQT